LADPARARPGRSEDSPAPLLPPHPRPLLPAASTALVDLVVVVVRVALAVLVVRGHTKVLRVDVVVAAVAPVAVVVLDVDVGQSLRGLDVTVAHPTSALRHACNNAPGRVITSLAAPSSPHRHASSVAGASPVFDLARL